MAAEEMDIHYEEHGKSDLTLTSESELFYAHQAVVCSQSPVFRDKCAALKVPATAEHTTLLGKISKMLSFWHHEPKNPTIHINGDDVAVEAMVHFFYHGDYLPDNYGADTVKFEKDATFHAAVWKVAKVYEVKELQILAEGLLDKAAPDGAAEFEDMIDQVQEPGHNSGGGIRLVYSISGGR